MQATQYPWYMLRCFFVVIYPIHSILSFKTLNSSQGWISYWISLHLHFYWIYFVYLLDFGKKKKTISLAKSSWTAQERQLSGAILQWLLMMEKFSNFNGIFFLPDSSQLVFWIALREIYLWMEILSQVSTGPQNPNKTMKQHRLSFLFWLHHWNHCLINGFCLKKLPSVFFYSAMCLHSCSFLCLFSWNQVQWCRYPSSYKKLKLSNANS